VSFSVQSDTEIWAVTHHEYTKGSDVPVFVEGPSGRSTNAGQAGSLTLGQPDS
jgi:hypothetical protein